MTAHITANPDRAAIDWRTLERFPGTCGHATTRQGIEEPCERIAVAVALDELAFAVCAYHANRTRSPLVSLVDVIRMAKEAKS